MNAFPKIKIHAVTNRAYFKIYVLCSTAGLAALKSDLPWSQGKKSLMVPVPNCSQFGDATFQKWEIQLITQLSHAKEGLLVTSGNQNTTDTSVQEQSAGHLWKSLPVLSTAVAPQKAKFGRGSVTSNPQACSRSMEILCVLPLSALLQVHTCGDAYFVDIFYLKYVWPKFTKLSNWSAVVICKLLRKDKSRLSSIFYFVHSV